MNAKVKCLDCLRRQGTLAVIRYADSTIGYVCSTCYAKNWAPWKVTPG